MKNKKKIACVFLALTVFLSGCMQDGYTQNVMVDYSTTDVEGEKYVFNYNQDDEFTYKTEDELERENGINSPDVPRYAAKFVYNFLGENVMPIGGYIEPKIDDAQFMASIEESLTDFALSGCNIITCVNYYTTSPYIMEMMQCAEKLGIMMLLKYGGMITLPNKVSNQEEATKELYRVLGDFYKMKSFAGLHVADEPGYLEWQEDFPMPKAREYFENALNNKLFFVNLLPIYSPTWAFPGGPFGYTRGIHDADYMKYYKYYMEDMHPQVVCYDYYPCVGAYPSLLGDYFKQIAIIKEFADNASYAGEAGVPFWSFVQVADWGGGRDVTYSEISWQINTALALGSKGLQYYTYNFADGHTNTVIAADGSKNRVYNDVQKANAQVLAVDEWLLNSNLKAVIQSGVMPNGEQMPTYFNRVKSYGKILSSSGVPHIIGCMDYYENNVIDDFKVEVPKEVYYVVNNTITNDGSVKIVFSEPVSGEYIVNAVRYTFSDLSELTVSLGAGEGVALKID